MVHSLCHALDVAGAVRVQLQRMAVGVLLQVALVVPGRSPRPAVSADLVRRRNYVNVLRNRQALHQWWQQALLDQLRRHRGLLEGGGLRTGEAVVEIPTDAERLAVRLHRLDHGHRRLRGSLLRRLLGCLGRHRGLLNRALSLHQCRVHRLLRGSQRRVHRALGLHQRRVQRSLRRLQRGINGSLSRRLRRVHDFLHLGSRELVGCDILDGLGYKVFQVTARHRAGLNGAHCRREPSG